MSFFPKEETDEQALKWSKSLFAAVRKRTTAVYNAKRWMRDFIRLRQDHGHIAVEVVLTWYCKHVGEMFVPNAFTSATFRTRFTLIQKAMFDQEVDNPAVIITERNQKLAEVMLNNHTFPPEIAAHLPLLVQRTREEWDTFFMLMLESINNAIFPGLNRAAKFLSHICRLHGPVFVDNWIEVMAVRYKFLKNYSWPVMKLAFSPKSQMFKESFWHQWSMEWCSNPTAFDSLLEELTKEKT